MINENYSNSDTITISDKSTENNPFKWDATTLCENHKPSRVSTTPKENGKDEDNDKLTTSNLDKLITETGRLRGNTKSSADQSNVIMTKL